MGRAFTRLVSWGAAVVVLGQIPALAAETSPSVTPAEPVVSVTSTTPVEGKTITVPTTEQRPLFQHETYPAAWKAAQKSNRPILVYVSMPNCHYCTKMKEQVYRLPRVRKLVAGSFETLSADRYQHPKLVSKLRIRWYPTTVLVGPNNKILDVIEGYADANKFQQRLQTGLASTTGKASSTQTR